MQVCSVSIPDDQYRIYDTYKGFVPHETPTIFTGLCGGTLFKMLKIKFTLVYKMGAQNGVTIYLQ